MKVYHYTIKDTLNKTKEIGSGSLNDLVLNLGENIIYLIKDLEKDQDNIQINIKTTNKEILIYSN